MFEKVVRLFCAGFTFLIGALILFHMILIYLYDGVVISEANTPFLIFEMVLVFLFVLMGLYGIIRFYKGIL